jgi:hypothetical protein
LATAASVVVGLLADVATANVRLPAWLSSGDLFATVAGVLATVVGLSLSLASWRRLPRLRGRRGSGDGDERRAEPTVESRIEEATRALKVTAGLVSELQAEMQARMAALERLRAENDEYEKLAAVRREEAEAVSRLIENVISSTHSKLGRSSRRDQVLFFVAGLAASIPVQILVNLLTR